MLDPEVVEPVITVEVVEGPRAPRLVVTGDLDLDGAKVLDRVIEEQGAAVELDLAGVEFMDSSGLRSLLVHRTDPGATVVSASPSVTRLCELAAVTFLIEEPETATS